MTRLNLVTQAMGLIKRAVMEWQQDKASLLAAALAFYTTFSLAPLLVIATAIASLVFSQDVVQTRILQEVQLNLGVEAAVTIQEMIDAQIQQRSGLWPTVTSISFIVFGSTIVFNQLQESLNLIWKVDPGYGLIRGFLFRRIQAALMAVGAGLLMLSGFVLSASMGVMGKTLKTVVPLVVTVLKFADPIISLGLITVAFAVIYKFVPNVKLRWGDVWLGAMLTTILFNLGRGLISAYLGYNTVQSAYGAVGSFVIILIWVYYSTQILLFGAEFTKVYARLYGSHRDS